MKDFFSKNRERILDRMMENEIAVLFSGTAPKSTADAMYRFKPNKNFFYFTGLTREHFIVTMLKLKDKVEVKLFIEEPNYDVEKWHGRKMLKETASEESGIESVEYLDKFKPYLNKTIYDGKVEAIYFDLEKLSFDEVDTEPHRFAKIFRDQYLHVNIKSLHNLAAELRVIKDEYEIDQIKNAIMLTKLGLEEVLRTLKPKLYEYQVEATFNHTIMMNGADGNAFDTIAASGKNAVILHYVENECKIDRDSMILWDGATQVLTKTTDTSGQYVFNFAIDPELAGLEPGNYIITIGDTPVNVPQVSEYDGAPFNKMVILTVEESTVIIPDVNFGFNSSVVPSGETTNTPIVLAGLFLIVAGFGLRRRKEFDY